MSEVEDCPLITPYTRQLGIDENLLKKLYSLRRWDVSKQGQVPFKWPAALRTEILSGSGTSPLSIREYQKVMAHHLSRMSRFICGDAVGLGKTISVITAACWLRDRYPDLKFIVVTTKSTALQWSAEFARFSLLRPFVLQDSYNAKSSYAARFEQFERFLSGTKKDVLVCKYSSLIGKRRKVEGDFDEDGNPVSGKVEIVSQEIKTFCKILKPYRDRVVLVFDEAHKAKTVNAQTRNLVMALSKQADRVWALSASVISNGLEEFYSIASAIGIRPLGNMQDFYDEYCVFRKQYVGYGRYKRVLVGYKNVPAFKAGIRPFFLGRSQRQVKEPLPRLTTVYHPVDLSESQAKLLLEDIPNGTFVLPPSITKVAGEIIVKERDPDNMMTMLSVYQLVANHPGLLDSTDKKKFLTRELSPKEEALLDLLDGDYRGEKILVFTKSRTWIDRFEYLTKNGHFTERKFLRITGAENEVQRQENKKLFQEPDSGYDLMFINAAAMEGVNLQQAAHMVLLDAPWSWGSLLQLVGRMVRMASPHTNCTLHIVAAKGTVDEYTLETLKGKKGVFEAILGDSHSAGIMNEEAVLDLESGMEATPSSDEQFLELLRAHVKNVSLKSFIHGEKLSDAQSDNNYRMSFEKNSRSKRNSSKISDEDLAKKW